MNLHEYQGKALFAEYNLPVSKGKVVFEAQDVIDACNEIGGSKSVSYTHLTLPTSIQV